jgi:hypothetical protein
LVINQGLIGSGARDNKGSMRWVILLMATASCAIGAEADPNAIQLPPKLVFDGQTFSEITYISHDASIVKIQHKHGLANLPIKYLPDKWQETLDYDPEFAAANEKKLAERNAAAQKRAAEAQAERVIKAEEGKRSITPDEIRAGAAQRQRETAIERAERDRENLARPREIKRPSPLASHEEKEAYRARVVMQAIERGEATVADLPEKYGGRPTGNSSRAIAARKAWDRNQAIEMENKLMREGRVSEAAALRQARLQQEANEKFDHLSRQVNDLNREVWWLRQGR